MKKTIALLLIGTIFIFVLCSCDKESSERTTNELVRLTAQEDKYERYILGGYYYTVLNRNNTAYGYDLVKINVNDGNVEVLKEGDIQFKIYNDNIYYVNMSYEDFDNRDYKLVKMDLDGNDIETIYKNANNFDIDDNGNFYVLDIEIIDIEKILKFKEGEEPKVLYEGECDKTKEEPYDYLYLEDGYLHTDSVTIDINAVKETEDDSIYETKDIVLGDNGEYILKQEDDYLISVYKEEQLLKEIDGDMSDAYLCGDLIFLSYDGTLATIDVNTGDKKDITKELISSDIEGKDGIYCLTDDMVYCFNFDGSLKEKMNLFGEEYNQKEGLAEVGNYIYGGSFRFNSDDFKIEYFNGKEFKSVEKKKDTPSSVVEVSDKNDNFKRYISEGYYYTILGDDRPFDNTLVKIKIDDDEPEILRDNVNWFVMKDRDIYIISGNKFVKMDLEGNDVETLYNYACMFVMDDEGIFYLLDNSGEKVKIVTIKDGEGAKTLVGDIGHYFDEEDSVLFLEGEYIYTNEACFNTKTGEYKELSNSGSNIRKELTIGNEKYVIESKGDFSKTTIYNGEELIMEIEDSFFNAFTYGNLIFTDIGGELHIIDVVNRTDKVVDKSYVTHITNGKEAVYSFDEEMLYIYNLDGTLKKKVRVSAKDNYYLEKINEVGNFVYGKSFRVNIDNFRVEYFNGKKFTTEKPNNEEY